jgi:hypothetical protein
VVKYLFYLQKSDDYLTVDLNLKDSFRTCDKAFRPSKFESQP